MNLVKTFVKDCKNTKCFNDWSIGWWVVAEGGDTSFKSSIPDPDYNKLPKPYSALTSQILFDCNLINSQGIIKYYRCE
jgi:hypothetical protein